MSTKRQGTAERIQKGNQKAEIVRLEINEKYHFGLVSYSGTHADKEDMMDFGDPNYKLTYQCKVRESGDDAIFESDKFIPTITESSKIPTYEREPGRDARCKAIFYVVRPRDKNKSLAFPLTKNVKDIIQSVLKEWGVPLKSVETRNGLPWQLVDFTDEQIFDYWQEAVIAYNKRVNLFTSKTGVEVQYKIDEGRGGFSYSKLLFYIPPALIEDEHGTA